MYLRLIAFACLGMLSLWCFYQQQQGANLFNDALDLITRNQGQLWARSSDSLKEQTPNVTFKKPVKGGVISIGVIDTGIDYLYPDLDDGLYSGYKVSGGNDMAYAESDLMDDNVHETQGAGIVTVNEGLPQVVTPTPIRSMFMVLRQYSTVIMASMIRATGLIIDGSFDDRWRILSLGLRGEGNANGAVPTAVDNGSEAEIVAYVAAGNADDGCGGNLRMATTPVTKYTSDDVADATNISYQVTDLRVCSIQPKGVSYGFVNAGNETAGARRWQTFQVIRDRLQTVSVTTINLKNSLT